MWKLKKLREVSRKYKLLNTIQILTRINFPCLITSGQMILNIYIFNLRIYKYIYIQLKNNILIYNWLKKKKLNKNKIKTKKYDRYPW